MNFAHLFLLIFLLFAGTAAKAQTKTVAAFDKVIISPHIEVRLVQGIEESVSIEETSVDAEKINIKVKNNTLRVYLDDAKEVTKNEITYHQGHKRKSPIYEGTQVEVSITYRNLQELSVRGEETVVVESSLNMEEFRVKVYGEPTVLLKEVHLGLLKAIIYGTGNVKIASGSVKEQRFTAYGEAEVEAFEVFNSITGITSYGAADFQINASEEIKITAFGEARVQYLGNPEINKGLVIGELEMKRIQQDALASDLPEDQYSNRKIPQQ